MTAPAAITPTQDDAADYAQWIDTLQDILRVKEGATWLLGDELARHAPRYRERTMETIADDVGIAASTAYSYRNLSAFFPDDIRRKFESEGLFYSHFKQAYRLGTPKAAYAFLEECVLNRYTVYGAMMAVNARGGTVPHQRSTVRAECQFKRDSSGRVYIEGLEGSQVQEGVMYDVTVRARA
jgi:hypothetical protein